MHVVLKTFTVRSKGKTYTYAWRGGPRIMAAQGTAAFAQEVAERHAERKTGDTSKISGLVVRYRASEEWKRLSAKTRANWSPWLDRISDHFGVLTIRAFDRPGVVRLIKDWRNGYRETPRAADMGMQTLSRLLSFAGEEGLLANNMASKVPSLYRVDRSEIIWTADDLAELEKHASAEVMHAARLAALTGLRQGDLLRLSWSHIGQHEIEVRTAKTSRVARIPIYDRLREALKAVPRRSTRVLTTTKGLPWKTGFGASWQTAVKAAGIDKHFHDLRGTAATEFYRAGLSVREIADIMAWSQQHVERLIDRYVKRDELLKDRIRRLDENARRTEAAKPLAKPGSGAGAA